MLPIIDVFFIQDTANGSTVDMYMIGGSSEVTPAVTDTDRTSPVFLPGEGTLIYPSSSGTGKGQQQQDSGLLVINLPRQTYQQIKFPQVSVSLWPCIHIHVYALRL